MIIEAASEFGQYTGDCVWSAVQQGAHKLAPYRWPLPDVTTLNRLTTEAIAANIGVGPRGEANTQQLEYMLRQWGMTYKLVMIANLRAGLYLALTHNQPLLLGLSNGQALAGDEAGLHGHEIAVLHDLGSDVYACGDGDNPACAQGIMVRYPYTMLLAAQPSSAYILTGVPGMALNISETNGAYIQKPGYVVDTVWSCTVVGHQYDVQHGLLDYYRDLAPVAGVALPVENARALSAEEYEQRFDLFTIHWLGSHTPTQGYLVPLAGGRVVFDTPSQTSDGTALTIRTPYHIG